MTRIGILALQGDVAEHRGMVQSSGAIALEVKRLSHLDEVDGLIIPGGESTTIGKLLRRYEMLAPLQARVREGLPVYGTCAGMILLADDVEDAADDQPTIGGIDITVQRNAFGRQRESFETDLDMPRVGDGSFRAVFIRAPLVTRVGMAVDELAHLPDGRTVAAQQCNILVTSFHPELTHDTRMHRYFLDVVKQRA